MAVVILALLDEVRERYRAPGYAPIVKPHESGGAGENRGDGQKDAPPCGASCGLLQPERPPKESRAIGHEKNRSFKGSADGENARSQSENNRVARAPPVPDSGQRSKHQRRPDGRHRAAPVAVRSSS